MLDWTSTSDRAHTYLKEHKELRESEKGRMLIAQAHSGAANFLFDLESGDRNSEVASKLSAKEIYDAVCLASSLSIEADGEHYTLQPYYPSLCEDTALEMLQDSQAAIESSLLEAALTDGTGSYNEIFPSATKMDNQE